MNTNRIQIEVREDSRSGKALGCVFSIQQDEWTWESWRPQDHGRTENSYRDAGRALNGMLDWMEKD